MDFTNYMPENYYLSKLIASFTEYDINNINYDKPIYMRNEIKQGKLSLNHIELIEFFVRLIKPKNFLELGVQFAECSIKLIDLIPGKYYGVDINTNNNIEFIINKKSNFEFYKLTTDDFFSNLKNKNINLKLDMAFIDACHTHSATYKDFLNIKEHMNDDGIIFFHDTYPASEYWTQKELCGDCYKTSEIIRKQHNDEFEIITFPINPGISIARKCKKQLNWL